MKVAIAPTETNDTSARGPGDPPRARDPLGADRHADHRHRGDADRERHRRQHEFEPRADAVAGEDLGAETRQHVGEDADGQHRLQRREAGDGADLQDVEEHRPLNAQAPDLRNDARPAGEQIPAHHGDADRCRRSASRRRRRACRIDGIGPRPRPSVPPRMIWQSGGRQHHQRRQFHVAGAAQNAGHGVHQPGQHGAAEEDLRIGDRLRQHIAAAAEHFQQPAGRRSACPA